MQDVSKRRKIWAWMMFDWANQPFYTLCLTFIFGPYVASVATEAFMAAGVAEDVADAQAQSIWSLTQTVTGLLIAVSAPILGALADNSGRRTRWIFGFSVIYVVAVWSLWVLHPDGSGMTTALVMFGLAMVGAEFALIFTNAMLPSLGSRDEIGKLSGSGMALGYAGGVLSLFIMLLLFAEGENGKTLIGLNPPFGLDAAAREGTRAVGPFSAIWFVVFMIPFFLWVRDGRSKAVPGGAARALSELWQLIRGILGRRSLAAYLGGSMLYRDALNALYGFGGVYAALVLDWSITMIGIFGIVAAIAAAAATWVGGRADSRWGPKPVIVAMVLVLMLVCVVIVGMSREMIFGIPLAEGSSLPDIVFYVLGALIGAAGGVTQAASRTLMVRHADPNRPTEAFGLYALSGKATAFLAPGLIGAVTIATGSARLGVSPVIFLFLVALIVMRWVDAEGETAAA